MNSIQLILPERQHASFWVALRREPEVCRFNPLQQLSESTLADILEESAYELDDENVSSFLRIVRYEDELIGTVSLKNISHMMGYGEIGYTISPKHHRKGLGTAVVKMWVRQIFLNSQLVRLMALIAEENHASIRLIERLGFQKEGVLREHFVIQGKRHHEHLYAMLKQDCPFLGP